VGIDIDRKKLVEALRIPMVFDDSVYMYFWAGHYDIWVKWSKGSGYYDIDHRETRLSTGTTVDSRQGFAWYTGYRGMLKRLTWDKGVKFRTHIKVHTIGDQVLTISAGKLEAWSLVGPHIGFKVVDDTLYASVADGTAYSDLPVKVVSAGEELELEVELENGRAQFWVNGEYVGELTTNLPSGPLPDMMLMATVMNTAAANKEISFIDFELLVRR